ncbi:3-hydroxyanthranilate 3,4-dioxygenase-like isoform X1 [Patiria miniata]|uniref:3-hydroxyanthranilate 3,4-dioxygenase n=2 Tax=Patiria miniata TaxID=46514 RepID=A0A914BR36_PATMI|nr:3-hydroxyanthranilate 3,4-dioxygenase-like isoform X1 [Patiria miniata]
MPAPEVQVDHVDEWLEENKKWFLPPVCNKMMHNAGQMKSFFVGGPNQRKDYHIEEGEEFFYMEKGDMCLKIVEKGKHKDIHIKEGECFLLPARIPHSPQRQENTIGLVLERERSEDEKDGLRYYIDGTTESLFEVWFQCVDLGTQLGPIIKEFFASEQYKTGKPIPGTIPENPPVIIDTETEVEAPFSLLSWMDKHQEEIQEKGFKKLFGDKYQFEVAVYGPGDHVGGSEAAETWTWQLKGTSEITVGEEKVKKIELTERQCMLIPQDTKYTAKQGKDSLRLSCFQDPRKKTPAKKD